MKVLLLGVGKTKEKYLLEGIEKFKKQLKGFCNFSEIYLKESSEKNNEKIIIKDDSETIIKNLPKGYLSILLDIDGKELSSEEFAGLLEKSTLQGKNGLVFVIGGHLGFEESLKKYFDFRLCLSKMTLTHQMIRLFFTEQLYRAFSILNNKNYHK